MLILTIRNNRQKHRQCWMKIKLVTIFVNTGAPIFGRIVRICVIRVSELIITIMVFHVCTHIFVRIIIVYYILLNVSVCTENKFYVYVFYTCILASRKRACSVLFCRYCLVSILQLLYYHYLHMLQLRNYVIRDTVDSCTYGVQFNEFKRSCQSFMTCNFLNTRI